MLVLDDEQDFILDSLAVDVPWGTFSPSYVFPPLTLIARVLNKVKDEHR